MSAPVRIEPSFYHRVWGSPRLEPWFPNRPEITGEVWFPAGDLLVKFVFTTDKLSVQVHPDDDYAGRHENSRGKTEMWYILEATPEARIAAGFRQTRTRNEVRAAAESGQIEPMLAWWPVRPGDTFFIPAGTVHAIGGGIVLCEIQQNSDITYRLYDYGRPRPLHLDNSLDVATLGPHPGPTRPNHEAARSLLAGCRYFTVERIQSSATFEACPAGNGDLLVFLDGAATVGGCRAVRGETWRLPAPATIVPDGAVRLLHVSVPR